VICSHALLSIDLSASNLKAMNAINVDQTIFFSAVFFFVKWKMALKQDCACVHV